ncbi:hypothetical protein Xen7305DRAFT_00027680 [Xenococcus sp. PCC 7305]|uniref:hypothetical protein n=1 Tax=Xenococcus sp. PCC 7305 TaxID=102125 RepID=UPI0002AC22AA|nr:hypothetical protein [Xenococcus sp. PCC 7305]ELS03049.1 hypothetical protein Xen7305DRAFT_00027680 [Xenococcus sp. PCC 7305]
MSQKDGFGSGFVVGSIIGGIVGGLLGGLLVNSRERQSEDRQNRPLAEGGQSVEFPTEESIEDARHRLEDKIAQLNLAIDDVRQQLETVNGNSAEPD